MVYHKILFTKGIIGDAYQVVDDSGCVTAVLDSNGVEMTFLDENGEAIVTESEFVEENVVPPFSA